MFNTLKKDFMTHKSFIMGAAMLLCLITCASCGSTKTAKRYTQEKEIEEKMAEFTKGGWQIHGTTRTLRGKLTEHFDKLQENPDLYETIGTSTGCRSITVCRAAALNAASVQFSTQMGQDLRGKTLRDMGLDESADVPDEFNKFQQACISHFENSIKGELQESLALIQSKNGLNNYMIYFIVNKDAVNKARTKAIKQALEETKLRNEYAKTVEKFIDGDID